MQIRIGIWFGTQYLNILLADRVDEREGLLRSAYLNIIKLCMQISEEDSIITAQQEFAHI